MGPDPGTRRQILAQGPTAARSASPRGTGVTPNHHIAMLQNRLSAGRRRGFTAVFRINAWLLPVRKLDRKNQVFLLISNAQLRVFTETVAVLVAVCISRTPSAN